MKIKENATSGATTSGSISTVASPLGSIQRRLYYPLNQKLENTTFTYYKKKDK